MGWHIWKTGRTAAVIINGNRNAAGYLSQVINPVVIPTVQDCADLSCSRTMLDLTWHASSQKHCSNHPLKCCHGHGLLEVRTYHRSSTFVGCDRSKTLPRGSTKTSDGFGITSPPASGGVERDTGTTRCDSELDQQVATLTKKLCVDLLVKT